MRKSAVKTLHALAITHGPGGASALSTSKASTITSPLMSLLQQCGDDLIQQCREREENVRVDVYSCLIQFVNGARVQNVVELQSWLTTVRLDSIVNAGCVHLNNISNQSMKSKESVLAFFKVIVIALEVKFT